MNYSNAFVRSMTKQLDQSRKAQFTILIKCRKFKLPIDIQYKLFESMVIPVIVHGCGICGFQHTRILEKLYMIFLKELTLRPSTSSSMIYRVVANLPFKLP